MKRLGWHRTGRWMGYDAVRVILGSVLLIAAALKSYPLAADGELRAGLLHSPWLVMAVIQLELLLALGLLLNFWPKGTWAATLACFGLFAAVSAFRAVSGESSCGCFGRVPVKPAWTAAMDLVAVLSLLLWRPRHDSSTPAMRYEQIPRRALTLGAAWLCIGLPIGLTGLLSSPWKQETFPIVPLPEELNLGTIWTSGDFSHTLRLRNLSSRELGITNLTATCGCTAIEPSSLVIPAGETRAVTLKLHIFDQRDCGAGLEERPLRASLIPTVTGCSGTPPRWELKGVVRRLLLLSPSFVSFDESLVEGQPFPVKTVRVTARLPLRSLEAQGGGGFASLDLARESDTAYVLGIQLRETLPPGPFHFEVTLTPRVRSGEKAKAGVLAVAGYVLHEVEPSPRSLHWGIVRIGQSLESRVVLHSPAGKPFEVKSVSGGSEQTDVRAEKWNNRVTLVIRCAAAVAGEHEEHVAVVVKNHNGKTFELAIPVTYQAF